MASVQYCISLYKCKRSIYVLETSSVDSSLNILTGRPYGGLAILFKRSLADKIRRVDCANKRICAIRYHQDGKAPLILINVYMPCDTESIHCLNPAYSDTISDIEMLLFDHIGDVILGGNWNTDPSRDTAQSKCFESFLERNSLRVCWDHALATQQPTYINDSLHATSCLDHFLMSSNIFDSLWSCCVNTNPLNPSDHRDISVRINTTVISRNTAEYQGSLKNSVAWHTITEENINEYKKYMDDLIGNMHINPNVSVCNDPLCDDCNHHMCIEH